MTHLQMLNVTARYESREVLHEISLNFPQRQISAIVGPNACGKSTLLRTIAGLHPLQSGTITVNGRDVAELSGRARARLIGILPQFSTAPEGIRVIDLVSRGRYPYQGWFGRQSVGDDTVVANALIATGITDIADRSMDELSGGQRQRAWVAMVLAQETDILLLDEPTTSLDLTHQIELLELFHALNRERETTTLMVLHDLNLAARYADHLVVMKDGQVITEGTPDSVLESELLERAFGLKARVIQDPASGTALVIPNWNHQLRHIKHDF